MKITIDVDCTPDEARRFLGLPDVTDLQEAMMEEVKARMLANLKAMDPEALFGAWFPGGLKGFEEMQKAFWSRMTQGAAGRGKSDEDKGSRS
jgi:hypothetical protein